MLAKHLVVQQSRLVMIAAPFTLLSLLSGKVLTRRNVMVIQPDAEMSILSSFLLFFPFLCLYLARMAEDFLSARAFSKMHS